MEGCNEGTDKKPGEPWKKAEIANDLKALQAFVGGRIETVTLPGRVVAICNEEGRFLGMAPCCVIRGIDFVGPVILAGYDEEGEFTNCPI